MRWILPWIKKHKIFSVFLLVVLFVLAALGDAEKQKNGGGSLSTKGEKLNSKLNQTKPTITITPSPTGTPTEKHNIVTSSQIVKKVNNKYRYFFDIRNKDTNPFEGSVTITLFTNEIKNPLTGDTFTTNKAIEPELGTSVYLDTNTGPQSVHGANGITKFRYVVKKNDKVVGNGEGIITDKFEDVDVYDF